MDLVELHLLDGQTPQEHALSEWPGRVVIAVVSLGALLLGLMPLRTPQPVSTLAPDDYFAAEKAMRHVQAIAKEPHPIGSPAQAEVRKYLLAQLSELGLTPEVRVATVVHQTAEQPTGSNSRVMVGTVHNIVVRVPGTASTGAILLAGHYDSAPTSPGAAGSAAAVATILETLRALKAGPPLRNDLVALLADGDVPALLGTHAFLDQDPLARETALVMRFEGIGTRGPAALLLTTRENGWLVGEVARAAPHPLMLLVLNEVAHRFGGGDAAFDDLTASGAAGLSFAFFSGLEAHHTRLDDPLRLDPRSVQDDGAYALSLVNHFGNLPLKSTRAPDAVAFNVADQVVRYQSTWAPRLAGLATLLLAVVLGLGLVRRRLTLGGIGVGLVLVPAAIAASALLASLAELALRASVPGFRVFLQGPYGAPLLVGALLALAAAATTTLDAVLPAAFRRPRGDASHAAAGLIWWAILAVTTALRAPSLSYLFVWPLVPATLALLGLFLAPEDHRWARTAAATFAALPAILLWTPALAFLSLHATRLSGLDGPPVAGLPAAVAAGLLFVSLLPHACRQPGRWLLPVLSLVAAVVLLGTAVVSRGFGVERPRPDHIAYVLDADTGKARWVSADRTLDRFTTQFFPGGGSATRFAALPASSPDRLFAATEAPAPATKLQAPDVSVLGDSMANDVRTLKVKVVSARGAPYLGLDFTAPGEIVTASVCGKPVNQPTPERNRLRVISYATEDGVEVVLSIRSAGPVKVVVTDFSNGHPDMPGVTLPRRPPDTMPAPFDFADPTQVTRTLSLKLA